MKMKRFRKLVLGRETLRQLEGQEAAAAQGGSAAVKTEYTRCATNCEACFPASVGFFHTECIR